MSNKHSQKFLDSAKKSTTNAIKTVSKRAVQKTVKAIGDLIGNKIADKIISIPNLRMNCIQWNCIQRQMKMK